MKKDFDSWNKKKKKTEQRSVNFSFKERDIFYIRIGENIGHESCGKGRIFLRPVLVFRKLGKNTFLGVPLSTTKKTGSHYFKFSFLKKTESTALLHQIRVFDVRRIERKIGMIPLSSMSELQTHFSNIYNTHTQKNSPPNKFEGGIPKERVTSLYSSTKQKTTKSIILLAHNIRSLWNVGSLFRTSDAFQIDKIYLTGYTGTPPRREIHKTALGAEQWIEWEYQQDPANVIQRLKDDGYTITGLELHPAATNITKYVVPERCCLLLGNEVLGISNELLMLCDDTVYIPMNGKKESLNVSVATGVALHQFTLNSAS